MGAKSRLKQERREAGFKRERPEPKPITELVRDCQEHRSGYACPNCHGWLQQKTVVGSGVWEPLHEQYRKPTRVSGKGRAALMAAGMVLAGSGAKWGPY